MGAPVDVTPLAGVWIEMVTVLAGSLQDCVTPLAGVWIEIVLQTDSGNCNWSLPLRECGLKSERLSLSNTTFAVTPLAGVWIEISNSLSRFQLNQVTPLAGVWIEILAISQFQQAALVTPLTGVWIEIMII